MYLINFVKLMKVFTDHIYNGQTWGLYDKYQSMQIHNYITHIFAIKAVRTMDDVEKGLQIIKHNISHSDYKNMHIQTVLIELYRHFNYITNALQLFECIEKNTRWNAICIRYIMKALIDNGLNEHDYKYMNINNNINHLLALNAAKIIIIQKKEL